MYHSNHFTGFNRDPSLSSHENYNALKYTHFWIYVFFGCQNVSLTIWFTILTMEPFFGISSFHPCSNPWLFINKSQDIGLTEKISVDITYDIDVISPEISLLVASRTKFMQLGGVFLFLGTVLVCSIEVEGFVSYSYHFYWRYYSTYPLTNITTVI